MVTNILPVTVKSNPGCRGRKPVITLTELPERNISHIAGTTSPSFKSNGPAVIQEIIGFHGNRKFITMCCKLGPFQCQLN